MKSAQIVENISQFISLLSPELSIWTNAPLKDKLKVVQGKSITISNIIYFAFFLILGISNKDFLCLIITLPFLFLSIVFNRKKFTIVASILTIFIAEVASSYIIFYRHEAYGLLILTMSYITCAICLRYKYSILVIPINIIIVIIYSSSIHNFMLPNIILQIFIAFTSYVCSYFIDSIKSKQVI